jgi:exopolysaccharide biosynthesis polyprenyl glycosylphosphotransferase
VVVTERPLPGPPRTKRRRGRREPSFVVNLALSPVVGPAPNRSWERWFVTALLVGDLAAVCAAGWATWLLRTHADVPRVTVLSWHLSYLVLCLVAIPSWVIWLAAAHGYSRRGVAQGRNDYRRPIVAGFWLLAIVCILGFATHASLSRSVVVCFFPVLVAFEMVIRFGIRQVLTACRRRGVGLRSLLMVGDDREVVKFAEHLGRSPAHGFNVVAACVPRGVGTLQLRNGEISVAGTPDDLVSVAAKLHVAAVAVVGHGRFDQVTLQQAGWQFERSGIDLLVAPDVVDLAGPRITVAPVTGLPLLHIGEPRIGGRARLLKDWVERLLAIPILLFACPVLAVAAVAIRMEGPGPIFYRQERVGYRGQLFTMLKFRSMVPDAEGRLEALRERNEHDGALFKIRDDPRITRVGRWLRHYSIDEMPQLLNVLRGDMVLVGPRPCLASEVTSFGQAAQRRFLARPGLTGLWQVSGRADISWEDAVRLDLYYVENWSPLMDISIIYRTLVTVARGRGAY